MIKVEDLAFAEDLLIEMPDDEFLQLAKQAIEAQPAIFTFISTYYEALLSEESKEFYIHLVYSIWLAYNQAYNLKKVIRIGEIEKMEKEEEVLMKLANDDAMFREVMKRTTNHPQAVMLFYIYSKIAEFFGIDEDKDTGNSGCNMNERDIIIGMMNTYINLLEKARSPLTAIK